MVEDQVDVGARCDGGQALQELVRGKDQVARAVVPRAGERADDAAVGETGEPVLRQRRTQEVAAETFEPSPVVGADRTIGMQIETLEMRVAATDRQDPRGIGCGPYPHYRRAGAVAERGATADGGGGELREDGRLVGEGIGRKGRRGGGGEYAPASQQAQDAAADRREEPRDLLIGRRGRGTKWVVPSDAEAKTPSRTKV